MTRSFSRTGTGSGRGKTYVENPRKDLPEGVAAPTPGTDDPSGLERTVNRTPDGRVADHAAAAELGRLSARARAERRSMVEAWMPLKLRVGGHLLFEVRKELERFAVKAQNDYRDKCEEIALDVGGGRAGVGVRSCVALWSHALNGSLAMYELATGPLMLDPRVKALPKIQNDLFSTAARLSAEARQALLTAHSLAAEEAKARAARTDGEHGALPGFVITEGEEA